MTKNHVPDVDEQIEQLEQNLSKVVQQSKENLRALNHLEARHDELTSSDNTNGGSHETT